MGGTVVQSLALLAHSVGFEPADWITNFTPFADNFTPFGVKLTFTLASSHSPNTRRFG